MTNVANVSSVKSVKIFTETGRGRKQCGGCGVIVGVRTRCCPQCQSVFPSKNRNVVVVPSDVGDAVVSE